MAPVEWKANDFLAGEHHFEPMLELMKSGHSQPLFRTKKYTFDLAVEVFCQFYFYCLAYEITVTWPKCILVCSITVTWYKINVECGHLFENVCIYVLEASDKRVRILIPPIRTWNHINGLLLSRHSVQCKNQLQCRILKLMVMVFWLWVSGYASQHENHLLQSLVNRFPASTGNLYISFNRLLFRFTPIRKQNFQSATQHSKSNSGVYGKLVKVLPARKTQL